MSQDTLALQLQMDAMEFATADAPSNAGDGPSASDFFTGLRSAANNAVTTVMTLDERLGAMEDAALAVAATKARATTTAVTTSIMGETDDEEAGLSTEERLARSRRKAAALGLELASAERRSALAAQAAEAAEGERKRGEAAVSQREERLQGLRDELAAAEEAGRVRAGRAAAEAQARLEAAGAAAEAQLEALAARGRAELAAERELRSALELLQAEKSVGDSLLRDAAEDVEVTRLKALVRPLQEERGRLADAVASLRGREQEGVRQAVAVQRSESAAKAGLAAALAATARAGQRAAELSVAAAATDAELARVVGESAAKEDLNRQRLERLEHHLAAMMAADGMIDRDSAGVARLSSVETALLHKLDASQAERSTVAVRLRESEALLKEQADAGKAKDAELLVKAVALAELEQQLQTVGGPSSSGGASSAAQAAFVLDGSAASSRQELQNEQASLLRVITAQRDRFKARVEALQSEAAEGAARETKLRGGARKHKQEMLAMVQKQNFVGSRTADLERGGGGGSSKYEEAYQKKQDPFAEFQRSERRKLVSGLSCPERTMLDLLRAASSHKVSRLCCLLYLVIIHVLVYGSIIAHMEHHTGADDVMAKAMERVEPDRTFGMASANHGLGP